jgi:hypothetical protein
MPDDFKELLEALLSHHVEFVVVGAHALAFHARPRYTEDLDIFIRRSDENRVKIAAAMSAFGLPVADAAWDALFKSEREMIVLGIEPNAVDLMNFLDGVSFEEAWRSRVTGRVVGVEAPVLGIAEYRKTKIASGRPKDMADLAILAECLESGEPSE